MKYIISIVLIFFGIVFVISGLKNAGLNVDLWSGMLIGAGLSAFVMGMISSQFNNRK